MFKYLIDQTSFKIVDFNKNSINGGSINFDLAFKTSKIKTKVLNNTKRGFFEWTGSLINFTLSFFTNFNNIPYVFIKMLFEDGKPNTLAWRIVKYRERKDD